MRKGSRHTAASLARMSAGKKGKPNFISPETRAKMVATAIGRKRSPETVAKCAAGHRGLKLGPISPEHRAKITEANRRRAWSPEARAKIVLANKSRPLATDEQRAHTAARFKGVAKTPEHRAKIAAATMGRLVSPDTRQRQSDAGKRRWESGQIAPRAAARYTTLARALQSHLAATGLTLEAEVRFGRYTVDLYDREHHVAYEADGKFWHDRAEQKNPGCHARRDAYLNENFDLPVVHFTSDAITALTGWPRKSKAVA